MTNKFKKNNSLLALACMVILCLMVTILTTGQAISVRAYIFEYEHDMYAQELFCAEYLRLFSDDDDKFGSVICLETHTSIADFTDVSYIPNANYFLLNPRHVPSNHVDNPYKGSCTTTAVQMVMGFHTYFSDRRLVPSQFRYSQFGQMYYHPQFKRDVVSDSRPLVYYDFYLFDGDGNYQYDEDGNRIYRRRILKESVGCTRVGTSHRLKDELLRLTFGSNLQFPGQTIPNVALGAREFIRRHAPAIRDNVAINQGTFSSVVARGEINAGRPVILGYRVLAAGITNHVMVAYGYATLDDVPGFIVHYGSGVSRFHVWVPEARFGWMIRMNVTTSQNFVETNQAISGRPYRVLRCRTTQVSTIAPLFDIDIINGQAIIAGFAGSFNPQSDFVFDNPHEVPILQCQYDREYFIYIPVMFHNALSLRRNPAVHINGSSRVDISPTGEWQRRVYLHGRHYAWWHSNTFRAVVNGVSRDNPGVGHGIRLNEGLNTIILIHRNTGRQASFIVHLGSFTVFFNGGQSGTTFEEVWMFEDDVFRNLPVPGHFWEHINPNLITFGGWWTKPDGPYGGGERIVNGSRIYNRCNTHLNALELHAHWVSESQGRVMFNAMGGMRQDGTDWCGQCCNSIFVHYGRPYGVNGLWPHPPVRKGFYFAGWWTSMDRWGGADFGVEANLRIRPCSVVSTELPIIGHTLYARWSTVPRLPSDNSFSGMQFFGLDIQVGLNLFETDIGPRFPIFPMGMGIEENRELGECDENEYLYNVVQWLEIYSAQTVPWCDFTSRFRFVPFLGTFSGDRWSSAEGEGAIYWNGEFRGYASVSFNRGVFRLRYQGRLFQGLGVSQDFLRNLSLRVVVRNVCCCHGYVPSLTVDFDVQGGTRMVRSIVREVGDVFGALPVPVRDGFVFEGWFTKPNGQGEQVFSSAVATRPGIKTLYASWV